MSAPEKVSSLNKWPLWAQIGRDLSWPKADRLLWAIETLKRTFASTQSRGSSRTLLRTSRSAAKHEYSSILDLVALLSATTRYAWRVIILPRRTAHYCR